MPPLISKKPKCKACGGTGKNSRGEPCYPCTVNKAKLPVPPPKPKPLVKSIFDD
jgi:hypothetical protein